MTKCVWMNVRQVMFLAEFAQPIGDAVGVQTAYLILSESSGILCVLYPFYNLR